MRAQRAEKARLEAEAAAAAAAPAPAPEPEVSPKAKGAKKAAAPAAPVVAASPATSARKIVAVERKPSQRERKPSVNERKPSAAKMERKGSAAAADPLADPPAMAKKPSGKVVATVTPPADEVRMPEVVAS